VRTGFVAVILWVLPLLGFSQMKILDELLATSSGGHVQALQVFQKHVKDLSSKQSKKEIVFLHKIFWSTQRRFLKTYSPYISFDELFSSGKYDCLTATSLYALILDSFHFDFDIIETNYHIFIIVHHPNGDVLFETTDRYNGFVQEKKEIDKRIGSYKQNLIATTRTNLSYYQYSFDLYKEIDMKQLPGLLHFNQAVNAFNKQQWSICAEQLILSEAKYNSPRIKELGALLIQSVLQSQEKEEVKEFILHRFKSYWLEKQPTVAIN
jgi:hypothetical protein